MGRQHTRYSLALIAVALVLLIAAFTGAALWILRRMNTQLARETAAKSVLDMGRTIASHLAEQPAVAGAAGEGDWPQFARLVRSLYTVEDGLQYVSVRKGGVVVFHQQRQTLDAAAEAAPAAGLRDVEISRRLLGVGTGSLAVVAFATTVVDTNGAPAVVEVALKRETVAREERGAAAAIASMFKVSLATIVVSFGACAALVGWLMHREALRERQRRAEEHLAFAGVLANGIVHDFRNPMSSLRLDVQLLQRETVREGALRPERLAELGSRICGTIDRMDKVFREFFYVSRPDEAGARPEPLDLKACVTDSVEALRPRFEQGGRRIRLDLAGDPLTVLAYGSALGRALINVITNAEQFSPPGGEVVVRAFRAGTEAVIGILDRGPGVPEADRARVFEMFYSTRPGGTGLGLFLARTAVDRCGGSITVQAREGGGSNFEIRLPLAG